jgi:Na+-driven multidrug efflux pump
MYIFSDFGIIGAAIAILSGRLFMQLSGFIYAKYFYKIPMVLAKPQKFNP